MSDQGTYPPPPPAEDHGHGQQAAVEPPPPIKTAVSIVWAVIAVSVLSTILTFVFLDDIVESTGSQLTDSEYDTARTGAIVGAIVGFLIFGALWVLLGMFLRKGANWARIVLTVLSVLGLIFGVLGLTVGDQPAIFLVLTIVQIALYAALLLFMWRRESSEYISAAKAR